MEALVFIASSNRKAPTAKDFDKGRVKNCKTCKMLKKIAVKKGKCGAQKASHSGGNPVGQTQGRKHGFNRIQGTSMLKIKALRLREDV